jgi:hypothetical protein
MTIKLKKKYLFFKKEDKKHMVLPNSSLEIVRINKREKMKKLQINFYIKR